MLLEFSEVSVSKFQFFGLVFWILAFDLMASGLRAFADFSQFEGEDLIPGSGCWQHPNNQINSDGLCER